MEAREFEGCDITHPLNLYKIPDGVMQIFLKTVKLPQSSKKLYIVISFGDLLYQSSVSSDDKKEWYEGFEFRVTYHQQIFDFLEVYEQNMFFPDRLIGKARIKISFLDGYPEVFSRYYEIVADNSYSESFPSSDESAIKDLKLGAVLVRINYRYQNINDPEPKFSSDKNIPTIFNNNLNKDIRKLQTDAMKLIDSRVLSDELFSEFSTRFFSSLTSLNEPETNHANSTNPEIAIINDTVLAELSDNSTNEFSKFTKNDNNSLKPFSFFKSTPSELSDQKSTDLSKNQNPASEMIKPFFDFFGSLDSIVEISGKSDTNHLSTPIDSPKKHLPSDSLSPSKTAIPSIDQIHKDSGISSSDNSLPNLLATFTRIMNVLFQNLGLTHSQLIHGGIQLINYHTSPEYQSQRLYSLSQTPIPSEELALPEYYSKFSLSSYSTEDLLVDLTCEYEKWNGGLVHGGVRVMAQWIFIHVIPHMLAYAQKNGIKDINFVGHSLGAATAAVLLLMIKNESKKLEELKIPSSNFKFISWCYGTLPCVSLNLAKDCLVDGDSDSIDSSVPFSIFSFVHSRDMISSLSYGSVMDIKQMILAAYEKSETFSQSLAMKFDDKDEANRKRLDKLAFLANLHKKIVEEDINLKLYVPGKVFLITNSHPGKKVELKKTVITEILNPDAFSDSSILKIVKDLHPDGKVDSPGKAKFTQDIIEDLKINTKYVEKTSCVYRINPESLNSIEFCNTMISDHFPNRYEDSLLEAMNNSE
ncbi:hypothetical protein AYI70_g1629 [Smittium culicis]|uniref:sn-1-specific diacylglycerol lipase n=1 Tax=Smittium culicis TaxID=133412 RepID=A0A1R1YBS8_9FUNG|nr:hypothetical protein AYI70_g1629 [Smittium culicis]